METTCLEIATCTRNVVANRGYCNFTVVTFYSVWTLMVWAITAFIQRVGLRGERD